jgi:hypothetical protein
VGRFPMGFIAAGTTVRVFPSLTTIFNPQGDWGQAYVLAHPRDPNAELVCDFHGKVLSVGRYFYSISVTNRGPFGTNWDLDF